MIARRWSFVLLLSVATPLAAFAQDREALLLRVPTEPSTGRAQPGVSASSPLGFGPGWRDVFIGFGYQAETRYGGESDGSASIGAGFGSADVIGLEAVITSLSTARSGFGDRMVGSVKLHRRLPRDMGIGVGIEGFKLAGDDFETEESFYVALSKVAGFGDERRYFTEITLNAGVGNGRFQSEEDIIAGEDGIGFFASAGLRVAPAFSVIADWSQDLSLGLSIAPFSRINFVITPGLVDITGQAGDIGGAGVGARFTLGMGLSKRF